MSRTISLALLSLLLILAACSPSNTPTSLPALTFSPPPATAIPVETGTATLWVPTDTPEPVATTAQRALTICLGAEPDSLFLYGGQMLAKSNVLEAVYDGPIDTNGFDYQPVILEKLPSLADGDAVIEAVPVQEGDFVVDDAGELVVLSTGDVVRPAGCRSSDCAVTYDGGSLEMDRLSATFVLLENVRWSDGEPLTAQDSVFSYQIARNCEDQFMGRGCGGLGLVHGNLSSVENTMEYTALDERTARWTGYPGFLDPNYRTNFFHPLPKHQLEGIPVEEMFDREETARLPMGWGPYILDKWQPGEYIRLHKNPYYFRSDEGLPRFDLLEFRFVGQDLEQNLASIQSGECDFLDQESMVGSEADYPVLQELSINRKIAIQPGTGTVWEHADFSILHADYDDGYQPGVDRPDFFGDPRARRAIALCMDRQSVVDEVLFGLSTVPDTYLPPEHPLFNPQAEQYAFSPEAASSLLEEIGWKDPDGDPTTPRVAQGVQDVPDGTPLSFNYITTLATYRQAGSKILADSMAQCGINVKILYQEASQLFADPPEGDLFSRRFDMAEFAWLTSPRPPCDLFMTGEIAGDPELKNPDGSPRFPKGWKGQNETGYSNPNYDQACRAALEALPEEPAYAENHLEAQAIFAEDLPVVPLYLRVKMTVTRPDFCGAGMDPTAQSDTWNIEGYGFGEDCSK